MHAVRHGSPALAETEPVPVLAPNKPISVAPNKPISSRGRREIERFAAAQDRRGAWNASYLDKFDRKTLNRPAWAGRIGITDPLALGPEPSRSFLAPDRSGTASDVRSPRNGDCQDGGQSLGVSIAADSDSSPRITNLFITCDTLGIYEIFTKGHVACIGERTMNSGRVTVRGNGGARL